MNKLSVFFIIFFIFISCKKENNDTLPPTISVFSPIENSTFNFGDAINIKARVEDNNKLESISIWLMDNENITVSSQITIANPAKLQDVNVDLIIDNKFIESGIHYLNIRAFDGENTKTVNIPIYINGIPKKFMGLIILCKNNNNTNVIQLDTNIQFKQLITLNGDYSSSDISSKYQLLFVAGSKTGSFNGINLTSNEINWSIPNQSSEQNAWFYKVYFNNSTIYVSSHNNSISAYNINGNRIKIYLLPQNTISYSCYLSGNKFFAGTTTTNGSVKQLFQYYLSSGSLVTNHNFNYNIIDWALLDDNKIYIFANDNNQGIVFSYDFIYNNYTQLHLVNGEKIVSVDKIAAKEFLILTNNKVYNYNNNSANSLSEIATTINGKKIIFDPLLQRFFVVKNLEILNYSFPEANLQGTYLMTDSIYNAHLYYNR